MYGSYTRHTDYLFERQQSRYSGDLVKSRGLVSWVPNWLTNSVRWVLEAIANGGSHSHG